MAGYASCHVNNDNIAFDVYIDESCSFLVYLLPVPLSMGGQKSEAFHLVSHVSVFFASASRRLAYVHLVGALSSHYIDLFYNTCATIVSYVGKENCLSQRVRN